MKAIKIIGIVAVQLFLLFLIVATELMSTLSLTFIAVDGHMYWFMTGVIFLAGFPVLIIILSALWVYKDVSRLHKLGLSVSYLWVLYVSSWWLIMLPAYLLVRELNYFPKLKESDRNNKSLLLSLFLPVLIVFLVNVSILFVYRNNLIDWVEYEQQNAKLNQMERIDEIEGSYTVEEVTNNPDLFDNKIIEITGRFDYVADVDGTKSRAFVVGDRKIYIAVNGKEGAVDELYDLYYSSDKREVAVRGLFDYDPLRNGGHMIIYKYSSCENCIRVIE